MTTTLNARQEAFAAAYVRSMNATQAAIEAGYSANGASSKGWDLLRNVKVQARIEELQTEIMARNDVEADRLIRHLYLIAMADASDLVQLHVDPCPRCWPDLDARDPARAEPDPECMTCRGRGQPRVAYTPVDQMSPGAKALFRGVRHNPKTGSMEVLMHDRLKAADMLMRHLGLYRDQDEAPRADPLRDLIADICRRGSTAPLAKD
ncbi:terminase small subunit [Rhodobaculum claviforme]|uniref:Terminase small subunit n=1 Tax=Rhodobaculum claviforme TaxID=1549854 RepID=A0A934WIH9_9RHOB|nr:terminase small subunit [Rhodobaculum claviforme]MBK5926866.1 hypothetical protein [Rhodobaculum claviforme]